MFLVESDFDTVIKADELNRILGDKKTSILNSATSAVLDEITSYLSGRYDTALAFAATGDERNTILVLRAVDMVLYHVYSAIAPRNIPDLRRDRFTEATDLFKSVSKGTRYLDLPLKAVAQQNTYYLYGSNKPFRFE